MAAALQIWSPTFTKAFDSLPLHIREELERKVSDMARRLAAFPHQPLRGRAECKLRVGDYRVLYEFDREQGRIYLHYVGHRREIYG
ncbi:MAG TPA: type II toxin-antitoxin system RelE/ParE family toxin [Chthoniobacterales bacterium]|nr:type II toxin-antitoxin system RelE/ParE family toxin [Chthoniobacterales bacterium]